MHFGLGYLHWKLRQYDEAKAEFERELANDPNHAQALAYLGDIEMKRNNPDDALVLLKKAVQLRDDLRIAYIDMGAILAQQNHYQEAIAALQHAEKLDPSQPDAHLRLGRLYKATGNTVAAEKEFSKLRELHQKADDDIASKMSASPCTATVGPGTVELSRTLFSSTLCRSQVQGRLAFTHIMFSRARPLLPKSASLIQQDKKVRAESGWSGASFYACGQAVTGSAVRRRP